MKARTLLVIALALVCGGSAAVGVSRITENARNAGEVASVEVVVAATDAPRGAVLSDRLVKLQAWPKQMVPQGALTSIDSALDRSVLYPIVKGELIVDSKLASKESGRGLAAMIPTGMRAFTIRTAHIAAGVGGFILPGNHVDVLLTTSSTGARDRTGGAATTTLLQNVQVLAVAQRLDAPDTNKVDPKELKSVTLLVTPDQAAMLDLGMNKGILHLSLRNPEDKAEADTRPALMSQLRFYQERPTAIAQLARQAAGDNPEPLAGTASQVMPAGHSAATAPKKRRYAEIQTLRGTHRGAIRIERSR